MTSRALKGCLTFPKIRCNAFWIFFAPTAPNGFERNWILTLPGKAWFAAFRFYGPLEAYFDKSWPLPDIEWVR